MPDSQPKTTFGVALSRKLPEALAGTARQQQTSARSIRQIAYSALVICSDQNIVVDAWLPETIGIDVSANYDAPYAQGVGSVNDRLGALAQFVGMNLTTQAMTAQIWQGGSFINFQLPFIFQAETDAETDVMQPIKDLLRLQMPRDPTGGGILEAPGPHVDIKKLAQNSGSQLDNAIDTLTNTGVKGMLSLAKEAVSKNGLLGAASLAKDQANNAAKQVSQAIVNSIVDNISLYIGQFLYFPSVVVTDVSPTFDVILNGAGKPTRASVNVSFRTFYIPTQNDIELMFSNMVVNDQR